MKSIPTVKTTTKKAAKQTVTMPANRKIAIGVGAVGCFVLLLSVWHCTDALSSLTAAPLVLAALLAIGIDFGMVACEMASIISNGPSRLWAERYIWISVGLSMVLNSVASGAHAESMVPLAYTVGGIIPVLVFVLFKVAGLLWNE